jgi:GMP synthase (glutamine-hydrolysing)
MELIAQTFNGIVVRMDHPETGLVDVTEIVEGSQSTCQRWMNRNDQVMAAPAGFTITGVTTRGHIASITDETRWWGVQYHPESFHDPNKEVLHRFLALPLPASLA